MKGGISMLDMNTLFILGRERYEERLREAMQHRTDDGISQRLARFVGCIKQRAYAASRRPAQLRQVMHGTR